MTLEEVLAELKQYADPQTKKTYLRHQAQEPVWGVKIGDLQKIRKKIKVDCFLSLELFNTGIADAMYLAGLIADPPNMRKATLEAWAKQSTWSMVSDAAVAAVAAESPHGWDLAAKWIKSKSELIATTGWSTYSHLVTITPDEQIPLPLVKSLIESLPERLPKAPNRVKYSMNGFLISVGCCIQELTETAVAVARKLGKVEVDMGDTECKVPSAEAYIDKVRKSNRLGKKRESARC